MVNNPGSSGDPAYSALHLWWNTSRKSTADRVVEGYYGIFYVDIVQFTVSD